MSHQIRASLLVLPSFSPLTPLFCSPSLQILRYLFFSSLSSKNEFQNFIRNQIIESTKVKLGESIDPNDLDGLGNCYCLTNPRLRENPIVLVSEGFESITGYSRQSIIGRNCRFLQGPSTNPESIQRVRDALNTGEAITELVLNYRKDGTPFWCLLNIIPLREANGKLAYFIGGQSK